MLLMLWILFSFYSTVYSHQHKKHLKTHNEWKYHEKDFFRDKRSTKIVLADAEETKNKSTILVKKLIGLGHSVHKILSTLEARKGDKLMKELAEYNAVFEEFSDLIKHDNINTRTDVEEFLNQPHPNIAETDHDKWEALARFNWAEEQYQQFTQLMYFAREHWIELIYIHTYY